MHLSYVDSRSLKFNEAHNSRFELDSQFGYMGTVYNPTAINTTPAMRFKMALYRTNMLRRLDENAEE